MSEVKTEKVGKHAGWKTSEFWAFAASSLIILLNKAFDWNLPVEATSTVAGLAASYIIARSVAKAVVLKEQVKANVASDSGSNQ